MVFQKLCQTCVSGWRSLEESTFSRMWIGWCFPQYFYVSNFPFSIFRVAIQNFRTKWETHLLWNQGIAGLPHFSASLLAAEWVFSVSGRICMVISSTLPQKCMKMPQLVTCVCALFQVAIFCWWSNWLQWPEAGWQLPCRRGFAISAEGSFFHIRCLTTERVAKRRRA